MARGPEPELPELVDPKLQKELEAGAAALKADPAAQEELAAATKALEDLTRKMERGAQVTPEQLAATMERLGKAQEAFMAPVTEAAARLEAAARRVEEALTAAQAPFEEIEREAVLGGDPEPPPGSRDIPPGRWSYHPSGTFVRYFPEDHTRARIEVLLPQHYQREQQPEPHGRHDEGMNGGQVLCMVTEECSPGGRGRLAAAEHVLADR